MRRHLQRILAGALAGLGLLSLVTFGPPLALSQMGGAPVSGVVPPFLAGGGSQAFKPGGVLYWEYTNTANAADTLYVSSTPYALPAGTLATNGDQVMIEADLLFDATASTKTYVCNIGYSAFDTTTGFTGGLNLVNSATTTTTVSVHASGRVTRSGATTANIGLAANLLSSGAWQSSAASTGSITWANAQNMLCIAKSSVATAGIVTLRELRVTWNPR